MRDFCYLFEPWWTQGKQQECVIPLFHWTGCFAFYLKSIPSQRNRKLLLCISCASCANQKYLNNMCGCHHTNKCKCFWQTVTATREIASKLIAQNKFGFCLNSLFFRGLLENILLNFFLFSVILLKYFIRRWNCIRFRNVHSRKVVYAPPSIHTKYCLQRTHNCRHYSYTYAHFSYTTMDLYFHQEKNAQEPIPKLS